MNFLALQSQTFSLAACPTIFPPAPVTFHTVAEAMNRFPVLVTRTFVFPDGTGQQNAFPHLEQQRQIRKRRVEGSVIRERHLACLSSEQFLLSQRSPWYISSSDYLDRCKTIRYIYS